MRSFFATAVLAALIALLAAGCGGSGSDKKANEAYASSVCSAIGTWVQQIRTLAAGLSGQITKASLRAKFADAEAAARQLVRQIKATPPPDTSEGRDARQQVRQFTTDVTNALATAKAALVQLGSASAATITAAVASLAPQVQGFASEAKSTITALKTAGGNLASAFKSSDACKNLG